ncbi:MAG: PilN domain-containing protein [Candidatus Omnitrophota bacterium]|nr:PilN domain-containing protein [Candidatus Omnitrophota bacterium]
MIEINLLPEELKVKKVVNKKLNFTIYLSTGLLLIILVIINLYVVSLSTAKNIQLTILAKKWESLAPQRQKVEEMREQSDIVSQDIKAIQQVTARRILWSGKLNKLSLLLPSGVWVNEISLNNKNFILRGSAVSLKKEEMSLINLLLSSLKEDKQFFSNFNSLDLTSVQRRQVGGYEVADFILTGSLKAK